VRASRRTHKEVFVPLSHAPGHGQADFGEAWVIIDGVQQKAHFFVLDLPHSDACYVRAYPRATTEAWLDGHNCRATAFIRRTVSSAKRQRFSNDPPNSSSRTFVTCEVNWLIKYPSEPIISTA